MKRIASEIILTLVIINMLTSAFDIQLVSAGNYNGTDLYSSVHQNELRSDGISDTLYIIV